MAMDFSQVADDFFVNLNLQTTLPLPTSRESVLHFFEAVQKEFPDMTSLYQRDGGEFVLEGDREVGTYQWLELQGTRMTAGSFNPETLDAACRMHRWLLERSIYFLSVSPLDVECLDLMLGFNLDYVGNRDALVAHALLGNSPLATAMDAGEACLECEPGFVLALDEECSRQARLSIETRGSSYQVRTGEYDREPISVYFTVREYPRPGELFDMKTVFARQQQTAESLTRRLVVPHILKPLSSAIASE